MFNEEHLRFSNELDQIGLFWRAEFKGYFSEIFDNNFILFGIRNFGCILKWTPSIYPTYTKIDLTTFSKLFKASNRNLYFSYGALFVINDKLI